MKANRLPSLALAFLFTFIFYGLALGDGGPGPTQGCDLLPTPSKGPFLNGFFTTAYNPSQNKFNIHLVLYREVEVPNLGIKPKAITKTHAIFHLFSVDIDAGTSQICGINPVDLKKKYEKIPCNLKVGEAFGLTGIPVLTDLTVIKCDEARKMIFGTVKIQVVPVPTITK